MKMQVFPRNFSVYSFLYGIYSYCVFHLPLRERKKPPRLPVTETGAVHYALFVLSQALTRLLAGVLDSSLGGCQNYRAFGTTAHRYFQFFSWFQALSSVQNDSFHLQKPSLHRQCDFVQRSFFTSRAILFSPQLSPFTIPFSMPLFSTLSSTSHISSVKVTACPKDKASTSQPTHRLSFRVLTQRVSVPHSACPIALH